VSVEFGDLVRRRNGVSQTKKWEKVLKPFFEAQVTASSGSPGRSQDGRKLEARLDYRADRE